MTPMKDHIKKERIDDTNDDTNVENTNENPIWNRVEDNCVPEILLTPEIVSKVIKVETDTINDFIWESSIEIAKDATEQCDPISSENNNELGSNNLSSERTKDATTKPSSSKSQNGSGSSNENTNNEETFCCNICGKSFPLNVLNNHMEDHKKQSSANVIIYKCNFCDQTFKLNFSLNRHIQKYHSKDSSCNLSIFECNICKKIIDKKVHNEHMKNHEIDGTEKKTDSIFNLKLCKLNGVWKSKPNLISKCNTCFKSFDSENDLVEHMQFHRHDSSQTQCEVCLKYVSNSELNEHLQQMHKEINYKCQRCNIQFHDKRYLNRHLVHCNNNYRHILKFKNNLKNLVVCPICRLSFPNVRWFKKHMIQGCRQKKYKKSLVNKNKTSTNRVNIQSVVENNSILSVNNNSFDNNSSDHVNATNSSQSSVQTGSHNPMIKKCSLEIKKNLSLQTNVSETGSNQKVSSNESFAQNVPHSFMMNSSLNLRKENCLMSLNVTEKSSFTNMRDESLPTSVLESSSDQINPTNKFASSLQNGSYNSVLDRTVSIKQEKIDQIDALNSNKSTEKTIQHNLMMSNSHKIQQAITATSQYIQKKLVDRNSTQSNFSDEVNPMNSNGSSIHSAPHHNPIMNDNLKIKKEKHMSTNVIEENLTHHIGPVINISNNVMVKKEPRNSENNHTILIERESVYFIIKKISTIRNSSTANINFNSVQTQKITFIFECKICAKQFENLHLLALHMSDHDETTMHECIVCDQKFDTVVFWKNHMTNHNLESSSKRQISTNVTKFNGLDTTYSDSIRTHPPVTNRRNRGNEMSSKIMSEFKDINTDVPTHLNNNGKKFGKQYHCKTCQKRFSSKLELMAHQKFVHNTLNQFICPYCDRTFSSQGPCTNHIKSHRRSEKLNEHNAVNNTLEPTSTQYDIHTENGPLNIVPDKNERSIIPNSLFVKAHNCGLCTKKFIKRSYWINHMKVRHGVDPNVPDQVSEFSSSSNTVSNINGEENSVNVQLVEPSQKLKENQSVDIDNNLNNSLNNRTMSNSSFCTICNKQFAHCGALTSHMHVHSNLKPHSCQYCDRKFSMKGPFTLHVAKAHKDEIKNIKSKNLEKVKFEFNEEQQTEICINSELMNNTFSDNPNSSNIIKNNRIWYICDVCDKKFSTPFHLIAHRKIHADIEPFLCKICNKSYTHRCHWNRHLKSHYMKNKQIKNSKNSLQINNPILGNVKSNLKTDSDQFQNPLKCGYCKKGYISKLQWKTHLSLSKECRRHCKNSLPDFMSIQAKENYMDSLRFECHICKKTYSTAYNRQVHLTNVHKYSNIQNGNTSEHLNENVQENNLTNTIISQMSNIVVPRRKRQVLNNEATKCKFCGKCYSNRANLYRHTSTIHSKHNNSTVCNICGSIFKHKYSYREHLRLKHNKLPEPDISKPISETNNIKRNNAPINNTNSVKYLCSLCNINFDDNTALQIHLKTHNFNKHKCKYCNKLFETNVILDQHIIKYHNTKIMSIKKEYTENDAIQNIPSSLLSINNNPLQCKVCYKIVNSPSYLSKHMRLHTGVKPFKCNFCNMNFRFETNLKIHKRKIHKII